MTLAAVKLMADGDHGKTTPGAESPLGSAAPAMAVLDGFVPATKAQVAYWRQLCGAVHLRGSAGMADTEWPPDLSPQ